MDMRLFDETLKRLAEAEDVQIEAAGTPDKTRAAVWVVVDKGHVYIRSVDGSRAMWHQTLTRIPRGELLVQGERLAFTAIPVADAAELARVSEAYLRKYAHHPGDAGWMASPLVAMTTLRLELAMEQTASDADTASASQHAAA